MKATRILKIWWLLLCRNSIMEGSKMDRMDEYEVVGSFDCGGASMVIVKAVNGTHVMPYDEWELVKKSFMENNSKSFAKIENIKVA